MKINIVNTLVALFTFMFFSKISYAENMLSINDVLKKGQFEISQSFSKINLSFSGIAKTNSDVVTANMNNKVNSFDTEIELNYGVGVNTEIGLRLPYLLRSAAKLDIDLATGEHIKDTSKTEGLDDPIFDYL